MPTDCAIARLSTGAHHRAPARALDAEPERGDEKRADDDDEDAIGREIAAEDVHLPAQILRQEYGRGEIAIDESRDGHRHQDEADGKQDLRELARGVETRIEQALEHDTAGGDRHERNQHRERKRQPERRHRRRQDVAARHGEHAMREVDEAHQAHRYRQADGDDVQDHAVSDAMEGDAYER